MAEGKGAQFDPAQLELILKRAAELQTSERDMTGSMSSEEVLALGRDVGIPERHLRQAMLEVSARVPEPAPQGLLDQVMGAAEVRASRVVRGDPRLIEAELVRYLDQEEAFRVLRQTEGLISWEPLGGWQGAMRRVGSRAFMLQRADRIVATVTSVEPGLCQVSLDAVIREYRKAFVGGSIGMGSVGVAATAVLAALGALWPLLLIPVPVTFGVAWLITKQFRPVMERTQLGLECALDHLERGAAQAQHQLPRRAGLLDTLVQELSGRVEGRGPGTIRR
jgi:hypothetical protein